MRLTKGIRQEILRSVMNDLQKENYRQQAEDLLQKEALKALPKGTEALIKEHPECVGRRFYEGFTFVWPNGWKGPTKAVKQKVDALRDKDEKQCKRRREARDQVKAALDSVTTVKRLREAYPVLAPYAPKEGDSKGALAVPSDLPALKTAGFGKK